MCGYTDKMDDMLRTCNEGLAGRFKREAAFMFEDYSEADLARLMCIMAPKMGLSVEPDVAEAAVKDVLAKQRMRPNFANGRAVRNLLENAHRHAAGTITLGLSQTAGHAVVRVCDQGPGVPPDLRERIFEPFYRLPGATERDGGVGLGLALVKSIALRHGGSVHCEDHAGGGACFVMQLPLAPRA
jgi:light-regulated signal transduction histidine kinase (bacteriophytochrome)